MTSEVLYTIEKIVDRKKVKDKFQYLIKWQGYPMEECTWEPIENLQYSLGLVEEYNKAHPKKSSKGRKTKNFLNKKRKDTENKKIKDFDIQKKNNDIQNNNNNIEEKKNLSEEETIVINKSLLSVITVKKVNEKLIAVVKKKQENGEEIQAFLSTEDLRKINPWILLDFYESKIKYS